MATGNYDTKTNINTVSATKFTPASIAETETNTGIKRLVYFCYFFLKNFIATAVFLFFFLFFKSPWLSIKF